MHHCELQFSFMLLRQNQNQIAFFQFFGKFVHLKCSPLFFFNSVCFQFSRLFKVYDLYVSFCFATTTINQNKEIFQQIFHFMHWFGFNQLYWRKKRRNAKTKHCFFYPKTLALKHSPSKRKSLSKAAQRSTETESENHRKYSRYK